MARMSANIEVTPRRKGAHSAAARPPAAALAGPVAGGPLPALFLSESPTPDGGATGFLDGLTAPDRERVRAAGRALGLGPGETVFRQGDPHTGVFLIEEGAVRTFYSGPSGREITLAYWPVGHFVGGPEVFGGGVHVWSGETAGKCRLLFIRGGDLRRLMQEVPMLAVGLVEGLVEKGKCYSALIQMLGTRSVVQRLTQLLLILGELYGVETADGFAIGRKFTHEELANVVGSTRQWVTATLDRLTKQGLIAQHDRCLVLRDRDVLSTISGY